MVAGVAAFATAAAVAHAAPLLDGVRDASYGSPVAVQTVQTGFGDANPNGGSELDAAYAQVEGGVLYLMLTGNLENNFNKLNVFFDSRAGGQNQLANDTNNGGNNPPNDGWAGKYAGFTFDTGFTADYMMIFRNGNSGGDRFDVDFATIGGGASAFESTGNIFGGSLTGSNASALPLAGIGVAHDRSNTGGVTGGSAAADPLAAAAVTTGIEIAIPLAALGNLNPSDILVSAMINGGGHDYLSNQFLGGLNAPQGNLGGDGAGNFNGTVGQINLNAAYAGGLQYFAIPEPSAAALAGIAVLALARRRAARG